MISPMTQEKCEWAAVVEGCVERRKYVCPDEYLMEVEEYSQRIWSDVAAREYRLHLRTTEGTTLFHAMGLYFGLACLGCLRKFVWYT
jgi:hypothetical protein